MSYPPAWSVWKVAASTVALYISSWSLLDPPGAAVAEAVIPAIRAKTNKTTAAEARNDRMAIPSVDDPDAPVLVCIADAGRTARPCAVRILAGRGGYSGVSAQAQRGRRWSGGGKRSDH